LMDFYSHSNYVQMYLEYWTKDLHNDIRNFTLNDIPTWDDAITTGFKTSQWYSQVRTGDFDLGEFITGGMKKPTHHDNMNMDGPDTDMGILNICPTCRLTYFLIAKNVATRHTSKLLK